MERRHKERKMKANRNRIFILISAITVLALGIASFICVFIISSVLTGKNIQYNVLSYEKWDGFQKEYISAEENLGFEGKAHLGMNSSTTNDIIKNPSNYAAYWLHINFKNISDEKIHGIKITGHKNPHDTWVDTSSLYEGVFRLEANETNEAGVLVIIKVKDKSEEEIKRLIRGTEIYICYFYDGGIFKYIWKTQVVKLSGA